MTLVLTAITPECITQVSDRRLINVQDGTPFDDETNKAIWAFGMFVGAYTGLASIENERTDTWAAKKLANLSLDMGSHLELELLFQRLANAATQAYRPIHLASPLKRAAFVFSGWGPAGDEKATTGFIALVSNYHEERNGHWEALPQTSDAFVVLGRLANPRSVLGTIIGQGIGGAQTVRLFRGVAAVARRTKEDPWSIARWIGCTMREVASRNPAVGKSLMIASFPKACVGDASRWAVGTGMPRRDEVKFLSVRGDDNRMVRHLPQWVPHPGIYLYASEITGRFRSHVLCAESHEAGQRRNLPR